MSTPAEALDLNYWQSRSEELGLKYKNENPFPHIVLDDFLDKESAASSSKEFMRLSSNGWTHFAHYNKKTRELNELDHIPSDTRAIMQSLNSDAFLKFLEEVTGITDLIPDRKIETGGLLLSERGGFLNIHADFTTHPIHSNWRRRINVLVYLNENWQEEYGGHLEFWSKDMKKCERKILPIFNRCVIFNTDRDNYHGHPEPLLCPANEGRKTLGLYYYTDDSAAARNLSTYYKARPEDGGKKFLIALENWMLMFYNRIKVTFGISDQFASSLTRFFKRKK